MMLNKRCVEVVDLSSADEESCHKWQITSNAGSLGVSVGGPVNSSTPGVIRVLFQSWDDKYV